MSAPVVTVGRIVHFYPTPEDEMSPGPLAAIVTAIREKRESSPDDLRAWGSAVLGHRLHRLLLRDARARHLDLAAEGVMKKFRSAKEAGRYFDKHEVTARNSRPVKAVVDKRYDPVLAMRIPPDDLAKLKALADAKGTPTATMGRILLLERLRAIRLPKW